MKRFISVLIICAILASCGQAAESPASTTSETTEATTTTAAETTTTAETTNTTAEQAVKVDIADLPTMDGSTSATPLEIGLKSQYLGITYDKAEELVEHTTTHQSFERLINGEVDMIFSVPISVEQEKAAESAGVTLTQIPAAKEGFVFVVNANNPVDSLTTEQLRGIYSGEITNWSEVGGNDEPIVAYQRNTDSGSQNYMTEFMGDVPLIEPESKYIAVGMGGIMDAVATYDNAENAIGYSVYSYAAQMYANANKVKFISIDGVKPTKATMADGSYPLSSCTYMICTDKSAPNTKIFMDWVASDEGQAAVLNSGYLPVNGMELPDNLMPYEGVGTGKKNDSPTRPLKYQYGWLAKDTDFKYDYDEKQFKFTCFADEELQDELNAKIKEMTERLSVYADDKYIKSNENDSSYAQSMKENWRGSGGMVMTVDYRNGFLSVTLGYPLYELENYSLDEQYNTYEHVETLVYDLIERKEITKLSDLFYEGTDFAPLLNNALSENISNFYFDSTNDGKKSEFSGILGSSPTFSFSSSSETCVEIWFEPNNPYFYSSPFIRARCTGELEKMCIINEYRDASVLFTNADALNDVGLSEYDADYFVEDGWYLTYYTGSRIHTDEEVAKMNEKLLEYQRTAIKGYRDYYGMSPSDSGYTWRMFNDMLYRYNSPYYYTFYWSNVSAEETIYIDSQTGKMLLPETLLCENWRDYLPEADRESATFMHAYSWDGESVNVTYKVPHEGSNDVYRFSDAEIPTSEVNQKYWSETE